MDNLKYDGIMMMPLGGTVVKLLSRDFIVYKVKPSMRTFDLA